MTDEEIQETLDAIEATRLRLAKSPEAAREFLIRSGIMKMIEDQEAEAYGERDETSLPSPY